MTRRSSTSGSNGGGGKRGSHAAGAFAGGGLPQGGSILPRSTRSSPRVSSNAGSPGSGVWERLLPAPSASRLSGSTAGSNAGWTSARHRCLRVAAAVVILFPWLVLLLMLGIKGLSRTHAGDSFLVKELPGARRCVGWRETLFCHPFAERYSAGDKDCDTWITKSVSGYCLCEGNITTARVTCGPKRFTCRQKCAELAYNPTDAVVLPTPITCPFEVPYSAASYMSGMLPPPSQWRLDAKSARQQVAGPWQTLWTAIQAHGLHNATVPGIRNETHDFVREGIPIKSSVVEHVRHQVESFKSAMPAYPESAFKGRGIVLVGGGLRYIVPAWISVHRLRSIGCRLPIEVWYPLTEYPSQPAIDAFEALGVTTRPLDFPGLDIPEPFTKSTLKEDPQNIARFTIKIAALVLSSFQEILYLDVDNIPYRDPTFLLDSKEFNDTGALFWQDYWANTMAPEAGAMLGVHKSTWYPGSFESGQMVVDKARHWRGLLAATYLNAYATFFYEIFTGYLGKGDKETFAYGMALVGEHYTVIPTPPGSLGTTGTSEDCPRDRKLCRNQFTGNTMVQYDMQGRVLFLHANLHKFDLGLPDKFSLHYQRRWQRLLPGGLDWEVWSNAALGYDLERKVYDMLRELYCQPWWPAYHDMRVKEHADRATPNLDGWHKLLRGIDLTRMYRQGWRGNYIRIIPSRSLIQRLWHVYNGQMRPLLVRWHLARRQKP